MSVPDTRKCAGFTLLEVMVALFVLTLVVGGVLKMVIAHERLVAGMEEWLAGDPEMYVAPPVEPMEYIVGVPAVLSDTEAKKKNTWNDPDYTVTVLDVTRELNPEARAAATVYIEEIE